MSLYWPPQGQQIDLTQPRLHAFVIGVGAYPHLIGGSGKPATNNYGLRQLTTTLHTARKIAPWLATKYRNPNVPLGSVELLLSPAEQLTRDDGSQVAIDEANMKNITASFGEWWNRCHANAGNIALLYFAGHGLYKTSQFLLPSDFGNPDVLDDWENCIDFDRLRLGMRKNDADTQLFFVDACRETPVDILTQLTPSGKPLAPSATIWDQVTASATYYASSEGLQAYGPADGVTYFADALLDALDGAGTTNGGGGWVVDTFSLATALGQIMRSLGKEHEQTLTCNPVPTGLPVTIHHPPAPVVRTSITCQTPQAKAESAIVLKRGGTVLASNPGEDRPWKARLHPGEWSIEVKFQSFPPFAPADPQQLMPPVFDLEVEA